MNNDQRNMVNETLAQYGAGLDEADTITKNGKSSTIKVRVVAGRIRFEHPDLEAALYISGPISPVTVENYVEKYWFWEKLPKKTPELSTSAGSCGTKC